MMAPYLKKKKSVLNTHKIVRDSIQLNKHNDIEAIANKLHSPENITWTNNWMEQTSDMKSLPKVVNHMVLRKNKLIIKWWAN